MAASRADDADADATTATAVEVQDTPNADARETDALLRGEEAYAGAGDDDDTRDPYAVEYYSVADRFRDVPRLFYVRIRSVLKGHSRVLLSAFAVFALVSLCILPVLFYLKLKYIPNKIREIVYTKESYPHVRSLHFNQLSEQGLPIDVSADIELTYKSPVTSWLDPTVFNISLVDPSRTVRCTNPSVPPLHDLHSSANEVSTLASPEDGVAGRLLPIVKAFTSKPVRIPHSELHVPFNQKVVLWPQCIPNVTEMLNRSQKEFYLQLETVLPIRMVMMLFDVEYTKQYHVAIDEDSEVSDLPVEFSFINSTVYGFVNISTYIKMTFSEIKSPNDTVPIVIDSDIRDDLYFTVIYESKVIAHVILRSVFDFSTENKKDNIFRADVYTNNLEELNALNRFMKLYMNGVPCELTIKDFVLAPELDPKLVDDNGRLVSKQELAWVRNYFNGYNVSFVAPYVNMTSEYLANLYQDSHTDIMQTINLKDFIGKLPYESLQYLRKLLLD